MFVAVGCCHFNSTSKALLRQSSIQQGVQAYWETVDILNLISFYYFLICKPYLFHILISTNQDEMKKCVKPGVIEQFLSGTDSLEVALAREQSLVQVTGVKPLDSYECLVMISDGQTEIGVLMNRIMFRMDIIQSNLVAKFNITDIVITEGTVATSDLKVTKYKTPRELQQLAPHLIGAPMPWLRPGTEVVYQPRGRFSTGGTELPADQAPLLLCGAVPPTVPGRDTRDKSDAEKIADFLNSTTQLPEVVGHRSLKFVPHRMPVTYLKLVNTGFVESIRRTDSARGSTVHYL